MTSLALSIQLPASASTAELPAFPGTRYVTVCSFAEDFSRTSCAVVLLSRFELFSAQCLVQWNLATTRRRKTLVWCNYVWILPAHALFAFKNCVLFLFSVVIKVSKLVAASGVLESPIAEIELLRKLGDANAKQGHPNIVRLIASHQSAGFCWQITPFAFNGDLCDAVRHGGAMSESSALAYFKQLACGVAFLHSQNVAHCDISLENAVVDAHGCLKIVDFGEFVFQALLFDRIRC